MCKHLARSPGLTGIALWLLATIGVGAMRLMTTIGVDSVPAALGVCLRHYRPGLARRAETLGACGVVGRPDAGSMVAVGVPEPR